MQGRDHIQAPEPAGVARLKGLGAANARLLAAAETGDTQGARAPYYGYFVVDIFDCPPFVMFTNNDCPRASGILSERSFEPGSMALWCRYARTATAIFDIGAHVGVYALAAAALRADIPVYAFEPNPFASARLRLHKQFNGFDNLVDVRVALAHKNSVSTVSWSAKPQISSGASLGVRPAEEQERCETAHVQMAAFDGLGLGPLGERGLMKIDVEGAERVVFEGMSQALHSRPDIILESFLAENCEAINAKILPLGYKVYIIHEDTGALTPQERLRPADRGGRDYNQFLTTRSIAA